MIPESLVIVAEYPSFVVVDKPSGLLSVPGRGPDKADCVVSRFCALYPDAISHPSVHRLDMETSGLMVLAREKEAHKRLSWQFMHREVSKTYIALIDGILTTEGGTIELPFRLDVERRPWQIYDEVHGKWGTTHWRNLGVEGNRTRVEFTPVTGRTHQLRLHASHAKGLGYPIVGDTLYGTGTCYTELKLHAARLSFFHPETHEHLHFTSPVPF